LHADLCGETLACLGGSKAIRRVIHPPALLPLPSVHLQSDTFEQTHLVDFCTTAAVISPRLCSAR
jgi:hypothetical protein